MVERRTLSSGYIIVGAYADKIRKVLFGHFSDKIKAKEIDPKLVAKYAGDLNKFLYEVLVNRLKLNKGDVVRVRIDYEYDEDSKELSWDFTTLRLEVFRREPEEKVKEILEEAKKKAEAIISEEIVYDVKKLGITELGDEIYEVYVSDKSVGILQVTKINEEIIVKGAFTYPESKIIERARLKIEENIENTLKSNIGSLLLTAKESDYDKCEKIIGRIKSSLTEEVEKEEEYKWY